jgi:AAA family ATPase
MSEQRVAKRSLPKLKYIVIRPLGYPMRASYHEDPEIDDPKVFEQYAKEQWVGEVVKKGKLLFDSRMFPDFAFEVISTEPSEGEISNSTVILVEQDYPLFEPRVVKDVSFDDIVGQEEAKKKCRIILEYLKNPEKFGEWAPRNILFYGPSGTGKTMMAMALSKAAEVPFIPVKSTQLIGDHVGEGARRIHNLFDKASQVAPCIVFFDEFDSIALDRSYQELRGDVSEVVNALLTEMDGIHENTGVCTIAATNRINFLDQSIRSRFEEEIEFKLPTLEERIKILEKYTASFPVRVSNDVNFITIAKETDGFSGRDLVEKILKPSLHWAIIDGLHEIDTEIFIKNIRNAKKIQSKPPKGMFV